MMRGRKISPSVLVSGSPMGRRSNRSRRLGGTVRMVLRRLGSHGPLPSIPTPEACGSLKIRWGTHGLGVWVVRPGRLWSFNYVVVGLLVLPPVCHAVTVYAGGCGGF